MSDGHQENATNIVIVDIVLMTIGQSHKGQCSSVTYNWGDYARDLSSSVRSDHRNGANEIKSS